MEAELDGDVDEFEPPFGSTSSLPSDAQQVVAEKVIEPMYPPVSKAPTTTSSPSSVPVLEHTLNRVYQLISQASAPYILSLLMSWRGSTEIPEFQRLLRQTRHWNNTQIEDAFLVLSISAPHLARLVDVAAVIELRLLHAALGNSESAIVLPAPSRIFHIFLTNVCQHVFMFPAAVHGGARSPIASDFSRILTDAWSLAVYRALAIAPLQNASPLMGNTSEPIPTAPPRQRPMTQEAAQQHSYSSPHPLPTFTAEERSMEDDDDHEVENQVVSMNRTSTSGGSEGEADAPPLPTTANVNVVSNQPHMLNDDETDDEDEYDEADDDADEEEDEEDADRKEKEGLGDNERFDVAGVQNGF